MNLRLGRKAALIAAGIGGALLLGWLATSQGPLAPAKVTLAKVEQGPLVASTFGIGTVEARRSYALGPTLASRVARVLVDQGDAVKAGQLLAELDPVDLEDRVASGQLAAERAASTIRAAEAQLAEAQSRAQLAGRERPSLRRAARAGVRQPGSHRRQGTRSECREGGRGCGGGATGGRAARPRAGVGRCRRGRQAARAGAARESRRRGGQRAAGRARNHDRRRARRCCRSSIRQACGSRRESTRARPAACAWASRAEIVLRSDPKRAYRGQVQRVDWVSDAVTEERIVNVGFAARPEGISVGELVEVTIRTAELANVRSVPAAAVKRLDRQDGVWQFADGRVAFRPVKVGITTLDGRSQILDGLDAGDEVVVHSEQALKPDAKVKVVPAIVRADP